MKSFMVQMNWNTTTEMMRETFDLHVAVPLAFARLCAEDMKTRGTGCLLHLASSAGLRGYAFTSAYTAAKHAINGMSKSLAREVGTDGVTANCICPGLVITDIIKNNKSTTSINAVIGTTINNDNTEPRNNLEIWDGFFTPQLTCGRRKYSIRFRKTID